MKLLIVFIVFLQMNIYAQEINLGVGSNARNGGVDGGGGEIGRTPIENVSKIIEKARLEFAGFKFTSQLNPYYKLSKFTFNERMKFLLEAPINTAVNEDIEHTVSWDFLASDKVEVKLDGPCLDRDGAPKDAVVKSADPKNAQFCFSAYLISRLPESAIYREVLALFMHEISHIYGATEAEANEIQLLGLENLDLIYVLSPVNPFISNRSQAIYSLKTIQMFLQFALKELNTENNKYDVIYDVMQATVAFQKLNGSLVALSALEANVEKKKMLDFFNTLVIRDSSFMSSFLQMFYEDKVTTDEYKEKLNKSLINIQNLDKAIQNTILSKVVF